MNKFDRFTKAFAFANFYQAFKVLFRDEGVAACVGQPCGGPTFECHNPCRCVRSIRQCQF
jgi:hypothetical protein